ncbi:putative baseplate assembly protein [Angustibacter sp. McL0619]|uniref:putative baseplate assembly protein n=1 Tax=Angustibacter sp. McL0619 TaxID=3415676 RepID=UPI003CF959C4
MALTAPNLDDRTFQDLVDDAKRHVQQSCPQWSDHNVSDPGVTLIEAFAQMVDQLIYRLNRVPDRHYVKFLELVGVRLRPPAAARGNVTFWLSAPQPQTVAVPAGTEVATPRTAVDDPVVFTTMHELQVVSCEFARCASHLAGAEPVDRTTSLLTGAEFECFSAAPVAGESVLIGLTEAVPSCAVLLRLEAKTAGVGVRPDNPPWAWEAWTETGWQACEIEKDDTGGLNKSGDLVLHVPAGHRTSIVAGERAGWLRCRIVEAVEGQPAYRQSPRVSAIRASTIGGTVSMIHAESVRAETVGTSDGTPAQTFELKRRPVVMGIDRLVAEVVVAGSDDLAADEAAPEEVQTWTVVDDFGQSDQDSRHLSIDAYSGELRFGPAVRGPDGTLTRYGMVPPKGARIRIPAYRTGGGRSGNVLAGSVRVLKSSVPYVASVVNRTPAAGGADAETVGEAKVRGPLMLRSRGRAVTREDFEQLSRDVAPEAARVRCLASGADVPGAVRIVVVPHVGSDDVGRIRREDLDPDEPTLQRISTHLDERRLVGTRVLVTPADYSWLTAVVSVSARSGYQPDDVRRDVLSALYRMFHPLVGGPDGTGWPFGRPVRAPEVFATLAGVPGVDMGEDVRVQLFPATSGSGQRSAAVERLELPDHGLVYSFEHQVRVRR